MGVSIWQRETGWCGDIKVSDVFRLRRNIIEGVMHGIGGASRPGYRVESGV